MRHGIFQCLAAHPGGVDSDTLASEAGLDPFYLGVWCRAAFAASVLQRTGSGYRIDPITASLLTDRDSPAYIGGLFTLLAQPEVFDLFAQRLPTGRRTWWDEFSPEFIQGVASTCTPAYLRLVPGGFAQIPGLEEVLAEGADVVDLACGSGFGLRHLARTYPVSRLSGVDGDAYSLQQSGWPEVQLSTLEDWDATAEFDVAVINMSMHECRDLDKVTGNVRRALRPGGFFVISDFPFPDNDAMLRTVPGRIMSGVQFVEAQIGDQLLPTSDYVRLLEQHGFEDVGCFEITPTHAVTHARTPGNVGG